MIGFCAPRAGCKTTSALLRQIERTDMSYTVQLVLGFVGTALFGIFIVGLSYSISNGFAGFTGGLPFMIIVILVGGAALYDFWDECVRKK
jgi:hypothetical protein